MVSKEEAREVLKRIALEVNPKMEKGMEKYFAKKEEIKPALSNILAGKVEISVIWRIFVI